MRALGTFALVTGHALIAIACAIRTAPAGPIRTARMPNGLHRKTHLAVELVERVFGSRHAIATVHRPPLAFRVANKMVNDGKRNKSVLELTPRPIVAHQLFARDNELVPARRRENKNQAFILRGLFRRLVNLQLPQMLVKRAAALLAKLFPEQLTLRLIHFEAVTKARHGH